MAKNDDLARRAVACPRWRWQPGMLTQHGRICGAGYLVSDDVDDGGQPYVDCTDTIDDWSSLLPDLSDPATVGALLALVREAWGDETIGTAATREADACRGWVIEAWNPLSTVNEIGPFSTEAEALVAALEAAP